MQTKFNHRVPAVGKLAEQIAGEVSVIQQRFLGSANAAGGTVASFTGQLDDAVVSQARLAVVECCKQLVNLLSRPTEVLKQMALVVRSCSRRMKWLIGDADIYEGQAQPRQPSDH